MIKGIDVSENNGVINFKKVKDQGYDFVMIRATFGRHKEDRNFRKNILSAYNEGLKVGVYYYSYALSEAQGIEEVDFFLKTINPFKEMITYPVVIDMEDSDKYKEKNGFPSNEILCKIVKNATERISTAGYYSMCYASASWYKDKLNTKEMDNVSKWIAWWDVEEEKIDKTKYQMWQKSSKARIEGIETNVDEDIAFVEFDKLINYLENIRKIQEIKLKTGLEDITIQFISCYKHGQEAINKLYLGLQKPKLKNPTGNIHKVVQKFFGYEDKTIKFFENYVYGEQFFLKLYKAICE